MKKEQFQYYKQKYNLPTVMNENQIEGKVVDKYIEGSEYGIILFKDNTCLVLKSTSCDDYILVEDEIYEEGFIRSLKDEMPYCFAEYEDNRKNEWRLDEQKRKYEQYLKLKKEFE